MKLQSCNIFYKTDKNRTHSWKRVHKSLRSLHWALLPTPPSFSKMQKYNHRPNSYFCWPRTFYADQAGFKSIETCLLGAGLTQALAHCNPPHPITETDWHLTAWSLVFGSERQQDYLFLFCRWHKVVFAHGRFKNFPLGLALASRVRYR